VQASKAGTGREMPGAGALMPRHVIDFFFIPVNTSDSLSSEK